MNFLFPSFLWGLLAVAVPVAVHLFNFRRTRKIFFSNVELLRTVDIQTSSFRHLKHLLIMASRILLIVCLVMAFAQPFIPAKNESGFSINGVTSLYLDNSFSMQNEQENVRYLDVAINRLNEVLGLLKNAGHIQLLTNGFTGEEQSFQAPDKIRDRLTMVEMSSVSRTMEQVLRRQRKALEEENPRSPKQLFWVSDFQKSTTGDLSVINPDSTEKLFIVPVQAQTAKNLYVDSVWLNTPFLRELQNNILHVRIRNSGEETVQNQVIKLYIGGTQISSASLNIEGNGSQTAAFNFSVKGQGMQRGQITFDDFPVTFDNDYYFVLNASPKIRILHLFEEQASDGYIANVFGNDSIFQVSRFSVRNLDQGLLKEADLIVAEGIERPSGSVGATLQAFMKEGGSILVIPPGKPDVAEYNTWLGAEGIQFSASGTNTGLLALKTPDRKIPFFSDVFEASVQHENQTDMPSVVPVWRWNKAGVPLLFTRDEIPYFSRFSAGRGNLFLLAAPLKSEFGNFAQHALFVPVMYKIAALSVKASKLAYSFEDRAVELTVENGGNTQVFKLRRENVEMIPVQRLAGNKLTLEMPGEDQLAADQTLQPGYYDLLSDGKPEQTIALNYGKAESDLQFYTPEELRKQWAGNKHIQVFDTIEDTGFLRGFEKQYMGEALWKYFLYAALFFLLMEIALIRWMK